MSGWSHGYNVSGGYTFGFYRELSPSWLDLVLAMRGFASPRSEPGSAFRYLELGSGQGVGLCLLAAAHPEGEFLGIDFNPEHTAHARSLAAMLGLANVTFNEGDFAKLGADWPAAFGQFDYTVLHGIYSWVPQPVRTSIVDCLAEAVASGGVVYVSYNAMPGWTSSIPFQHMLRRIEVSGALVGETAINQGRALFETMEELGSGVTKALPSLKSRVESTKRQPAPYLVQEYLHENWHPLWFSQVATELGRAKLNYVGTATLPENLVPGILPPKYQEVLQPYTDPVLREEIADCLLNQSFRRDIFCRGPRRRFTSQVGWQDLYRFRRINNAPVPKKIDVKTTFGSINLAAASFASIFGAMGTGDKSLSELIQLSATNEQKPADVLKTLLLLVYDGWLGCSASVGRDFALADKCNATLANLTAQGGPYRHLAAPAIGSAIAVSDIDMQLLDIYHMNGKSLGDDAVSKLREALSRAGRRVAKDGKPVTGAEETTQLASLVEAFGNKTMPLWKLLGVVA